MKRMLRWFKTPHRTKSYGHYHSEDGRVIEVSIQYTRWDDLKRILIGIAAIAVGVGGFAAIVVFCLNC